MSYKMRRVIEHLSMHSNVHARSGMAILQTICERDTGKGYLTRRVDVFFQIC